MEGSRCPLARRGYSHDGRKGTLHIFVSDLRASVRAFTAGPTGTNLPTEYGPCCQRWSGNGNRFRPKSVAGAIARDGFFLVTAKERAQSQAAGE
jgi:hypothetical protein